MNLVRKKSTTFTLIALFVVVTCLSFLALPNKVYGFIADYESYLLYQEEGTDTGITEDYSDSFTDSGSDEYTIDDLHYYVDYIGSYGIEEYAIGQSYSLYIEYYEKGYVENAEEGDLGYFEFSDSGHDSYTYTVGDNGTDYLVDFDWSSDEWYEIKWIEPKPRRIHDLTCYQINITEDNKFELIFWYEYSNNNWIRIYNTDEELVYQIDFPHGQPVVIVDLPDGMYKVEVFHEEGKILQEFMIGKS